MTPADGGAAKKPRNCPFCGGKAKAELHDGFAQVRCQICAAATGLFICGDKQTAIAAWNRRVQP